MKYEIVQGETYGPKDKIKMDGRQFINCKFRGCELLFGGGNVVVDGCHFDQPRVVALGHAKNTIEFLRYMRQFSPDLVVDLADVIDSAAAPENPQAAPATPLG
jgi:hypothetical protein